MPRLGQRDRAKEKYWRKVFADWEISALSGAAFCRYHNINYSQFCDWRKTLACRKAEVDARTAQLQRDHKERLGEKRKEQSMESSAGRPRKAARAKAIAARVKAESEQRSVEFAEVKVIEAPIAQQPATKNGAPVLEIVFNSGTQLRLSKGCPPELLEAVITLLEVR